jgi:hypothetical protein
VELLAGNSTRRDVHHIFRVCVYERVRGEGREGEREREKEREEMKVIMLRLRR